MLPAGRSDTCISKQVSAYVHEYYSCTLTALNTIALNCSELDHDNAAVLLPRIDIPHAEMSILAKVPSATNTARNSTEFW